MSDPASAAAAAASIDWTSILLVASGGMIGLVGQIIAPWLQDWRSARRKASEDEDKLIAARHALYLDCLYFGSSVLDRISFVDPNEGTEEEGEVETLPQAFWPLGHESRHSLQKFITRMEEPSVRFSVDELEVLRMLLRAGDVVLEFDRELSLTSQPTQKEFSAQSNILFAALSLELAWQVQRKVPIDRSPITDLHGAYTAEIVIHAEEYFENVDPVLATSQEALAYFTAQS